MAWVKAGPEGALPVSTVAPHSIHRHPPYYHGVILLLIIEAIEFTVLFVVYFYLRAGTEVWPPPGAKIPDLFVPTVALILLLASVVPTYLADKAIQKGNQKKMLTCLLIAYVLGVIYLVLMLRYYIAFPQTWQVSAYHSIFWALIGLHWLFILSDLLDTTIILIWGFQGYFNAERNSAEHVDGLGWYFGAFVFIPIYITLYLMPYLI
jgi:cytochrome c oxidase subunit 3